jgi:hypothetical protein
VYAFEGSLNAMLAEGTMSKNLRMRPLMYSRNFYTF